MRRTRGNSSGSWRWPSSPPPPQPRLRTHKRKDLVDTAVAAGSFKTLAKLVRCAGLVGVLESPGPFMVFAPTDEAFDKVPKETPDALAKDKKALAAVLQYHVLTSA